MIRLLRWLLLPLSLSGLLYAQRGTGEISGRVSDPSGAAVANARVTAVDVHTSSSRITATNGVGLYSFAELQPGEYEVSVNTTGFARFSARAQITLGARIALNPALSLQSVQSKVPVIAEGGVQVETQTQMLSEVIDGLQLTELPTITRNPYDLVSLAGNVTPDSGGFGAGVAINGQRAPSTNITLDGAENTNSYLAIVGQDVPLDSVREFRLSQSTFTAEYGRASGGMVDVETKSGTNRLHGSAYEFNRISDLAANTYDNDAHGISQGVFTRNQFGFAIGGPILKSRLFFFQSTEWTRVRSEATQYVLVPTPEFIASAAPATKAYFDTFAGKANPINGPVYAKADLLTQGVVPTPGGPFDQIPNATPILGTAYYQGQTDAGGGNPQNSYSSVTRLDFDGSQHTKLFGRFALEKQFFLVGVNFSSPYPGYSEGASALNKNVLFALTHIFSNALVTQTKIAFDRLDQQNPLGTAPLGPALNFPGGFDVFGTSVVLPGYPESARGLTQYEWQFNHDITWVRGRHQLRAGGQFLHIRNGASGLVGTLASQTLGLQVADSLDNFLLGQVHSYFAAINPQGKFPCFKTPEGNPIPTATCTLHLPLESPAAILTTFNRNGAVYGQDTWRVAAGLTLNLGLRWEYYGVQYTNDQNSASNFFPGAGSNFAQQIRNGQVFTVPNSPIHNLWRPDFNNFGPRIGFAWDIFGDGMTSLRGGYGISYEGNFSRVYRNLAEDPPAYSFADIFAGTPTHPTIAVSTENLGPFASQSGSLLFPDSSAYQVDANLKTAYAETWSLSLERQLLQNTVASLAYSGSHGVHLYSDTITDVPGSGVVYGGDNPALNPLGTLNRQYDEIFTRANGAASIYHALLARVQGQNIKNTGLTLTANYTYSHNIDNLSSSLNYFPNDTNFGFLDFLNPNLDRGDSEFDVRHNFVTSAIWQEPFFRAASNGWVRQGIGGWTIASIFTVMTGTPFTVFDCRFANAVCPRYIPSGPVQSSGHAIPAGPNFFELIPLAPAVPYTNPLIGISDFGNCALAAAPPCPFPAAMTSRDYFRGPGLWTLDLGIYKSFQPHEGWALQFRSELFNALNHPNMSANVGQAEVGISPHFISASKSGNRNVQLALKLTF